MSTLLTGYLLLMALVHAGGVLFAAHSRKVLAAGINASLLFITLMLLIERF